MLRIPPQELAATLLTLAKALKEREKYAEAEVVAWRGMEVLHDYQNEEDSYMFVKFFKLQVETLRCQGKPIDLIAKMKLPNGRMYVYKDNMHPKLSIFLRKKAVGISDYLKTRADDELEGAV